MNTYKKDKDKIYKTFRKAKSLIDYSVKRKGINLALIMNWAHHILFDEKLPPRKTPKTLTYNKVQEIRERFLDMLKSLEEECDLKIETRIVQPHSGQGEKITVTKK